mmetsp:Transcript_82423/g.191468  ORF Transcript_82423/g.191468 Transcript_82423/m.191468 type:complete len:216 (-) Transcript_82423:421-1068(-)
MAKAAGGLTRSTSFMKASKAASCSSPLSSRSSCCSPGASESCLKAEATPLAVVSEPATMSVSTLSTMASSLSCSPLSGSLALTICSSSEPWPAAPLRHRAIHVRRVAAIRPRARRARAAVLHGMNVSGGATSPSIHNVSSSLSFVTVSSGALWPKSIRTTTLIRSERNSGTSAKAPLLSLHTATNASTSARMDCSYPAMAFGVRLCWMVRRSFRW